MKQRVRTLRKPTRLILDYDGTLTVEDTMALLGGLPKHPKMTWKEIVDAYMKDYEVYKDEAYPWKKYDAKEYSGWLAARKWVEHNSAQRVQDAAYFQGVTVEDVKSAVNNALESGELRLPAGWEELFEPFLPVSDAEGSTAPGSSIEILSVNWSETAIREALSQSASWSNHPLKDELGQYVRDMKITANEIEGLASSGGSSGRVIRLDDTDIRTSDDKLRYLESLKTSDDDALTVYIGDSSTDFDCLRAADLGIWLCEVPRDQYKDASKKTFKPLDFIPPPLDASSGDQGDMAMFYWTPNLDVVLDVLASR